MEKKTFRRQALRRLRTLSPREKRLYDRRVRIQLLDRITARRARTVMAYIPLPGEVDILPLIGTLRRRGITVLVPFMEGESFRLVQYRLPLQKKQYGVREPKFSRKYQKKRIDIAIVPVVGTDPTLRRVGFGKGMYDRFFARQGHRIAYTVFVQRMGQYSDTIITDQWDIGADAILTGDTR